MYSGLNIEAGTEDIRSFFTSLYIPDGGVYIIGEHRGEAFIVFTTEKDAQLAMRRSGNLLRGSPVTLHVSSIAELQRKLKSKLLKEKLLPPFLPERKSLPSLAMPLPDPATAQLIGVVSAIQGLPSNRLAEHTKVEAAAPSPLSQRDSTAVTVGEFGKREDTCCSKPSYVRLFGLPDTVTKQEICHFFKGLFVQDVIANVKLGVSHGCLVKFAHAQDACDALSFNHQQLGSVTVQVRGSSEEMWSYAIQQCQNPSYDPLENPVYRPTAQRANTLFNPQEISSNTICQSGPSSQSRERASKRARPSHRTKRQSLYELDKELKPRMWAKRCSEDRSLSVSPKRPRSCEALPPSVEFCVMVKNLSPTIAKSEIKELFGCPHIANSKIVYLLDKESQRTDTAFVVFDQSEDYVYALYLNGCHVGSGVIDVSTVTKEEMQTLLSTERFPDNPKTSPAVSKLNKDKMLIDGPRGRQLPTEQTCVYMRNLHSDITKIYIKDFFQNLPLAENVIHLLCDQEGNSIGEAVVQFKTEDFARLATKLNGTVYMGTRVLLRCISVQQMEDILEKYS
ncbi:RNA binding motif protein 12Ba isoform X2 [Esox lucius]|uniref:RNA binding motif protein 12Ba isoform X2 n=1 Tax=Esox lucius TaxID=8010 RepID=UPI001476CA40|nr:RNA binding motif protein 12Ba isoform X2 [Esox lucius]